MSRMVSEIDKKNCTSIINSQNSLFNLGMFTYSYEVPNIIQIALERLPWVIVP
jgi:hypothetical protein